MPSHLDAVLGSDDLHYRRLTPEQRLAVVDAFLAICDSQLESMPLAKTIEEHVQQSGPATVGPINALEQPLTRQTRLFVFERVRQIPYMDFGPSDDYIHVPCLSATGRWVMWTFPAPQCPAAVQHNFTLLSRDELQELLGANSSLLFVIVNKLERSVIEGKRRALARFEGYTMTSQQVADLRGQIGLSEPRL